MTARTDEDLGLFLDRERAAAYYNRYEKGFPVSENIKEVWRTRKLAPTDTRGARILVIAPDGERRVLGYDHAARDPHESALNEVLAEKAIVSVEQVSIAARGYGWLVEREP